MGVDAANSEIIKHKLKQTKTTQLDALGQHLKLSPSGRRVVELLRPSKSPPLKKQLQQPQHGSTKLPKRHQHDSQTVPKRSQTATWGFFGRLRGLLGVSWRVFGVFGPKRGRPWTFSSRLGTVLGPLLDSQNGHKSKIKVSVGILGPKNIRYKPHVKDSKMEARGWSRADPGALLVQGPLLAASGLWRLLDFASIFAHARKRTQMG